jgi:hypothetical protein
MLFGTVYLEDFPTWIVVGGPDGDQMQLLNHGNQVDIVIANSRVETAIGRYSEFCA